MSIVKIKTGGCGSGTAEEIGAKAAILAQVARLGLPVPPAFVLPIALGAAMRDGDKDAERAFAAGLADGIAFLEEETGLRFGHRRKPLLVSVRSGGARSMPGMLDTVLDVGCTGEATRGLIRMTGNPRFAFDCRRRFLEAYAKTVLGLDPEPFRAKRDALIAEASAANDLDLDSEALERLSFFYEDLITGAGEDVEDDAMVQLTEAARAVYRSWMGDRAATYRRLQGYEDLKGSAVMVQAMVFGNRGTSSASGVAFSRDPSTGAPSPVIDVLFEAQGEDVVSGSARPLTEKELAQAVPLVAAELGGYLRALERDFKDVQDVEFTIDEGRYGSCKPDRPSAPRARHSRSPSISCMRASLRPTEALQLLRSLDLRHLAVARFVGSAKEAARGIGAAGGVAVGRVAFDAASAERLASTGDPVILVRPDIATEDVAGLAAVFRRAHGDGRTHRACLADRAPDGQGLRRELRRIGGGCRRAKAEIGGVPLEEGDWISVDGDTGEVFFGQREIATERPEAMLAEIETWREDAAKRQDRAAVPVAE